MATEERPNAFVSLYERRIGEPTTADEAYGYWLFVVGTLLGVIGIGLFVLGDPATTTREVGIALLGVALVCALAGPILRLPVQRLATGFALVGGAVCLLGVGWFVTVYPQDWFTAGGASQRVITLYGVGLAVLGIGGAVVPMVTDAAEERERAAATRERLETERDELRSALAERDERIDELEADADEAGAAGAAVRAELAATTAELDGLQESQARFELYEDRGERWRWRLRHRNGNVVAASGQGYADRRGAQRGLDGVRRNALGAALLVVEPDDPAPETMRADDEPIQPTAHAAFETYEGSAGEWRWRLAHDDGTVLADSDQGFGSERDARRGLESARRSVREGAYLRVDPAAFELYREGDRHHWRLVHRNGAVLASSEHGYASRPGARDGVESVRRSLENGQASFETRATDGEWRWRLVHQNGSVLAVSNRGYASRDGVERTIDRVRGHVVGADALDIGRAVFEVYEDDAGEYRWRLRHRNGNVLADGAEGYARPRDARRGIDAVKRATAAADDGDGGD